MSMATPSLARSSPLRTLLQVNVACLTALSGGIFAFAEGGPIAAASIPIALCALRWNDIKGAFSLNAWMANGLGLLAIGAAGFEFFVVPIEGRLLGFGHLLIYLSWILMWQKKGTLQFWLLCTLSILQVATSSVLTNSIWLGLLLVAYVLFALWTLSIFTLDRAVQRSTGSESSSASLSAQRSSSPAENSVSRNGVKLESTSGWITPRFVTGVVINGLLSISVGITFFVFTPRVWVGSPRFLTPQASAAVRSVTGYTEEVSVGDMGEILENHDLVLEASFLDNQTGQPIDPSAYATRLGDDAPLFRGAVLGSYDNGRWSLVDSRLEKSALRDLQNIKAPLVKQQIRMHSIETETLFTCGTTVTCLPADRLAYYTTEYEILGETFRRVLLWNDRKNQNDSKQSEPVEVFEYDAYSLADGRRPYWPLKRALEARYVRLMTRVPTRLGPLRGLAKDVTSTEEGRPLSPVDAVERLIALLRDSGQYRYSLNLSIDDPTIDPVVDFVVNRKEGHCEYFASALVLMLRSVGIPARYVSGFKGGVLNKDTGWTEVRQHHAHAWVEAYVNQNWIVLDPTPAARDQAVSKISESSHYWADFVASIRSFWLYGLSLTGDQQRDLFLTPLKSSATGLLESLQTIADAWNWQASSRRSADGASRSSVAQTVMRLAAVVVLLTIVAWWVKRGPGPLGRRLRKSRSRASQRTQTVAFYERFREILARSGHQRGDSQTPREFAVDLDQQLRSHRFSDRIAHIPQALTQAFYQVRFGQHVLPTNQLSELNTSLDQFEQSLSNGDS